jgi:hypothetical protein
LDRDQKENNVKLFKNLGMIFLFMLIMNTAHANPIESIDYLYGNGDLVDIIEIEDDYFGLTYEVSLAQGVMIDSFAVSNNGFGSWMPPGFWEHTYGVDEWSYTWISAAMWDGSFSLASPLQAPSPFNTNDLGLFADLFGTGELGAYIFTSNNEIFDLGGPVNSNSPHTFNVGGMFDSEFIAMFNGVIIDGSKPEPVPEPSTLAIFALGMMGLASRRFKKQ